ncbi:aspartyl protease family protein [Altererythrobacter arenosus]|uniref:Aspartyl protease family protein n=1 Tax=Altererythrobacter arenosus TaxID=3032592 RepID=A0ABY8FT47_9SPHN|nr:aspartyl protease family protein [Altererythrobacter sp. CAU 1644]WFL78189.1 aspartyl protease family protein [Altererythrobacter sp. CAU 1644]
MSNLWLGAILPFMLIGPLHSEADQQAVSPDLSNPETETLAIEEDRNRRYTIPVTIQGVGPFDFMIDTGSQATAVTYHVTDRLPFESLGKATLVGMASRRTVDLVELDNLRIGNQVIHNVAAPVLEKEHVGAEGIIGLDSLQDFRVLLDFRNETITVEDVSSKSSRRGYEIIVRARHKLGQLLITDALVDGVKTVVIIDTGAQASMGNIALREKIRARREHEVETMDVNGVKLMANYFLARSLEIQGMELTDVPITYADTPAFEALGLQDTPVLSLGMEHLKLFDRISIDFSNSRIMFDLPGRKRWRSSDATASRM